MFKYYVHHNYFIEYHIALNKCCIPDEKEVGIGMNKWLLKERNDGK